MHIPFTKRFANRTAALAHTSDKRYPAKMTRKLNLWSAAVKCRPAQPLQRAGGDLVRANQDVMTFRLRP
jgi:hypothetical protein